MNLTKRVEYLEVRARRVAQTIPVSLDHPADVLELLCEQINQLRADAGVDPIERARTVGLLAGLSLRAMEARDVLDRLEAVERVLKLRQEAQRELDRRRRP